MKDDKISMTQVLAIYLMAIIVPIIRAFPIRVSDISGKGAWVAAIIMIIPAILLVYILNTLINKIKKDKNESMMDVLDNVFGKTLGMVLSVLYIIWMLFVCSIELRLFAERLISTMMVYAPLKFFLITMLGIIFFLIRGKLTSYGRFAEIMIEIFLVVFAFISLTSVTEIDFKNLWPVRINNTKNILLGSLQGLSIFGLFTYTMFLGDNILDKKELKKNGVIAAIVTSILGLTIIVITNGIFSDKVVAGLSQPFFMALKIINVFGVLERIEAIFITFWVSADFMIISFYIIIIGNICRKKFNLSKRRLAITPIIFILYILSLTISNNYFSLELLSGNIAIMINLIFTIAIPIIIYITAKCRKLV